MRGLKCLLCNNYFKATESAFDIIVLCLSCTYILLMGSAYVNQMQISGATVPPKMHNKQTGFVVNSTLVWLSFNI